MGRILRDEYGRELLLAEGCEVEANVLLIHGEPLIRLENTERVPASLMETLAESVPGSMILGAIPPPITG